MLLLQYFKTCRRCLISKVSSSFAKHPETPDHLQPYCKSCANAYQRERNRANPFANSASRRKTLYGLDIKAYSKLFSDQEGCCRICGTHSSNVNRGLHVDHCHTTGKVRGLLCFSCNVALGYFKDRPDLLEKAQKYLLSD